MTYREESVEVLRMKLEKAESEIARLRTDNDGRVEEAQRKRRAQAWQTVRRALFITGCLAAAVATASAVLFAIDSVEASHEASVQAQSEEHRQHLEQMRVHVPERVDPRLWSWCIDHCERWHDGDAEGVLVQAFVDYGISGQTTTRVTVRGPWMTQDGADVISVSLNSSGVDASTVLHAGDLVRLHRIGGQHDDERVELIPSPFTEQPPAP